MDWYYSDGRQQFGPVAEADLPGLISSGRITNETLVWHSGLSNWQTYGTVRTAGTEGAASADSASGAIQFCSQCGQRRAASDLLIIGTASVCPNCKELYLQRMREGAVSGLGVDGRRFAGFWIRVLAAFIDYMIIAFAQMFVVLPISFFAGLSAVGADPNAMAGRSLALMGFIWIFSLSLGLAYESWFLVNKGATPGKMVLSLQVIRADGARLTWGLAIGRHFAKMLSGMILGIGYILVAFDGEKRALHDMICNTRVTRK